MKKTVDRRWKAGALGLLLVALVVVVLLTIVLVSVFLRARAFDSRPLVLIHSPTNRDRVEVGERTVVHATARADNGLARLELWADDTLVATHEAPESHPTSLTLFTDWTPRLAGSHALVVLAVAANGVEGQAAAAVEAIDPGESGTGLYEVQEGDTLESIAESHAATPEELAFLNPGLDPGGPLPGDELIVPDSEPPADEAEAPAGGGEAPGEEAAPPPTGIFEGVFRLAPFGRDEERVALRLEIPQLSTSETYDGLHCYVELAGSPPQWYPDADHDQSTDETFAPLDSGWWDTAPHLQGENAPVITWPGDQDLPLAVSCVGVVGGAEALELGRVALSIPPEEWNGTAHSVEVDGAEGNYYFDYRLTHLDSTPSRTPLWLDITMTPPTNIRLDNARYSLRWDYFPEPDEEPIDGFRVYLNGSLQWVEPPEARESGLPPEWLHPPCGETYTFAVTAFRIGFPDGPESLPGIAILPQPEEDCHRVIQITFLTLETFDLGGDGHHEDRHGDVGPPYGAFFANEREISFDAGHTGPGLDMPNGLSHNTLYDLGTMSSDPSWHFDRSNTTVVAVPQGGSFEFGYRIMDRDTGSCRDSGDRGCDDLICEGLSGIYEDNVYGELDQFHEGTLTSDDGRCRVTYRWGPAPGSPVGTGVEGGEPLPWLSLTDFVVDEATGLVQIHLRNTGTAGWSRKDLDIELQTREGETIVVYTWPDFVLEAGGSTVLQGPDMILDPPFDACVWIDPYNEVLEEYERTGALLHSPICPQLPDLIITDAYYDRGHIRVTVQNVGEGPLENRSLAFWTQLPDGTPLYIGGSWPDVNLAPRESRFFDLSGVSESIREQMRAGYSVIVNREGTVLESNSDNNAFDIPTATRLWIYWAWINVPYDVRNWVEFHLEAHVITGASRNRVADWDITQDIDWGSCFYPYHCVLSLEDHDLSTDWFGIFGDEVLEVKIDVTHPGTLRSGYSITEVFDPPDWGGGPVRSGYGCSSYPTRDPGDHHWEFDRLDGYAWDTRFDICRENYGEE